MDITKIFIEHLLYPAIEIGKGNKIRHYLKELKGSQELSEEALTTLHNNKLKKLLLHCIKNVPAYKEYSSLKNKIQVDPIEALKDFPVLTKEDFKQNPNSYIGETVSKENVVLE